MLELLAIWLALLALCLSLVRTQRREGTLLLAYLLGLSLIHVPGAVNFAGDVPRLQGVAESTVGFRATVIGMGALLAGAIAVRLALPSRAEPVRRDDSIQLWQFGQVLLMTGVVTSFALLPLAGLIPSATALTSAVGLLLIIGYWMVLKSAMNRQRKSHIAALLLLLPGLPFATLLFGGFAGFGIMWMIMVVSFYFCTARKVAALVILSPLAAWFGVSLAVSYFEHRKSIRDAVWVQQSAFDVRVERISKIVEGLEPYDFNNPRHVHLIDSRLNQNYLVGRAIERHQAGLVRHFNGSTVQPLALIPRALWPDKPDVGGGGELVSEVTGMTFDSSTSVGAGQPLEFYANFGWDGLVIAFGLLGGLLAWCDRGLADGFRSANVRKVLVYGLPGIALIQPGGNLIEIIVAVIASMIIARLAYRALSRWERSDPRGYRAKAAARR
jgi:hypothetical protein